MVLSRSISHDLGAAVAVALVTSSFLPEKSRQVPRKWHKPYRNATAAAPANLAATAPPNPMTSIDAAILLNHFPS
jgi:hypothetical protein